MKSLPRRRPNIFTGTLQLAPELGWWAGLGAMRRGVVRSCVRLATANIGICEVEMNYLRELGGKNLHLVYQGIDTNLYHPPASRAWTRTVVTVSHLTRANAHRKRLATVIRAIPAVPAAQGRPVCDDWRARGRVSRSGVTGRHDWRQSRHQLSWPAQPGRQDRRVSAGIGLRAMHDLRRIWREHSGGDGLRSACGDQPRGATTEVVGDCGRFVEPDDHSALARDCVAARSRPTTPRALALEGARPHRASRFSYAAHRAALARVIRHVVARLGTAEWDGLSMCGLAGFSGKFSEQSLREASSMIAHRGPDDSGVYLNELGIGLAFRRLAIIDLSPLGAQPMASANATAVIVFNGEIYNFRELRDDLSQPRRQLSQSFRHGSPAAALSRRGREDAGPPQRHLRLRSVGRARPILVDRARRTGREAALLRVDRPGLCLRERDQSPRAARAGGSRPGSDRAPPVSDVPLVPRRGHAVQGGSQAPARRGDPRTRRTDRTLLVLVSAAVLPSDWAMLDVEGDAVSATVEHLRRAVHRQLVADVPVGAFLSGGLDSSAVVTFAREQVPDLRCFTIESVGDQDAGFTDDLPYARRVAKHLQVPLEIVTVDAGAMSNDLEGMIGQLDEPLADPAPLNVLYISQLARRHGMKVLLSGAGGDDLFSGYRRHVALHYERYWRWLPQSVRAGLDRCARSSGPAALRFATSGEGVQWRGSRGRSPADELLPMDPRARLARALHA